MRIGISGPHGTGKTTLAEELCARLDGHRPVDEPYVLLEEEGYEFEYPPSPDDYRIQLRKSLAALCAPATRVVFDRTPLDFIAYLAVLGVDVEGESNMSALRSALASLDLLVILPITSEVERFLPLGELPRLQAAVNDSLLDLVYADPLRICENLPVIELTGPLNGRSDAVLAALRSHPE
ncbi:AAA family ATPase [Kribbella sp. CA-294648]|uniref:AAA family ATPase n=1 Tax=Kribbella sp. CA-294648 TaxID=3239948 RepID=UPI003D8CE6F7